MIVTNCICCDLCKTRNRIVNGRGDPMSEIWFIGRDPGREEDIQGKPFVGRAGKRLQQLLKDLDYDLDRDFYTVNLVRCHTPNNRGPSKEEVNACMELLYEEMQVYQPKLLILLGRHVVDAFLEIEMSMSQTRGVIFEHKVGALMPVYHPSFLIRNGNKYDNVFKEDIKRALNYVYQKLTSEIKNES